VSVRVLVDTEAPTLRVATPADADAVHALIAAHLDEGRLLPRTRTEIAGHASRFVVIERARALVGCAELAPLSPSVAEIRSLVVDAGARGQGVASRMVRELTRRARYDGFDRLCAFAHDPAFFVRAGFSIVPHTSIQEKIVRDCASCALFMACGQHALVLPLYDSVFDASTGGIVDDLAVAYAH